MVTLLKQVRGRSGPSQSEVLVQRVEALRERVLGPVRAKGTFAVEGLVFDGGATLTLHGDVNLGTVPHLDAVLDGVISLSPSTLTVDLNETTCVSLDALAAIMRRAADVERLVVRLPPAPSETVVGLLQT